MYSPTSSGTVKPRGWKRKIRLGFRGLLILVSLTVAQASGSSLQTLVEQRLALMQQVAAWKWHHELPIENVQREQQVLNTAQDDALQRGLDINEARQFFMLQIAAAKEIQAYWFELWRSGTPVPEAVPDLHETLRPKLLQLGTGILDALDRGESLTRGPGTRGLTHSTSTALQRASAAVVHYQHRLEQVQATGVLRVGFTGDYPPFSLQTESGAREPDGVDMELAREIAADNNLALRWIRTSWPTLMEDLKAGHFDIGMGGISITAQRRREALFTKPYLRGGKTPISRCDRRDEFPDLEAIDRRDVQIVVNPGGTNEAFVRNHINRATVIVHEDNRTIFEEIVAGRADLMITDAIEVRLQAARQPMLCPTMTGQLLTLQEKAFLLPTSTAWQNEVDKWLAHALLRTPYEQRLNAYLTQYTPAN